jgi:hypothetical protein
MILLLFAFCSANSSAIIPVNLVVLTIRSLKIILEPTSFCFLSPRMKKVLLLSLSASLLAVFPICASENASASSSQDTPEEQDAVKTHGKVVHELNPHFGKLRANKPSRSSGISYHGGPLILGGTNGGVNVYVIWYGNWNGNTATSIVADFLQNEGGSPYYNINTTYYNGSGTHVANAIAYSGYTTDNYSQGTSLSDAGVQAVVSSAISSGRLPKDLNGLYFVLTSADVTETSGFCTQYCGWHTHGTIAGSDIKYSFVGNPDRCPTACAAQAISPNGNAGADGMVSIIAHELEEAVSDPDLNAWFDTRGQENADKCAWTFGATYTTTNGAQANMKLGTRDYLIQQNWVNAGSGYCALSY